MSRALVIALTAIILGSGLAARAQQGPYQPNWESLDRRPIPAWYDQAKFGIFIHWGVYSVPAWGPKGQYAEWYWHDMQDHNGPTWKFHVATYGEIFRYQDFAPLFTARLWKPDQWADLFARAGARYVVLTSKHHEGFCLWPSAQSWNWNSVDVGPHRDLLGDLTNAVRARGLKMGFYYSLYEWYNPLYHQDVRRYVAEHMLPQLEDAVARYQPSIIFADGEWEQPSDVWRSTEFLAWLYNQSAVRDEVVVNDRWGKETRAKHGGYYTSEYGKYQGEGFAELSRRHKWEENQGIGSSFGYNGNEDAQDYKTPEQLVHLLVNIVSAGGNLLLDVGPTADGRIPVIMQERLLQMGAWLKTNREAIYGTRPWRAQGEGNVRYTSKGETVYAVALEWPGAELVLPEPKPARDASVTLLATGKTLRWREEAGKVVIQLPAYSPQDIMAPYAFVFKLSGVK